MARMVPFPMLPTTSTAERRLYEGFLEQLGDEYVVYHSVDWVLSERGQPEQGEADFVIAHPRDGVLVLEAKGGRMRYDPSTRRWFQSGRSGEHALKEDPFHQARDEMHSLVKILRAQQGWDEWRPPYGYGVAFPDGVYDTDAHPGAPSAVAIDRGDLDSLAARVQAIMATWDGAGRRFGERGMAALALALGERVEVRAPLNLLFHEEDKKIVELTHEQAFIRAYVLHRRRAAVTGPPGGGKTILATDIAKHLAEAGRRVLLTCFNKRLAEQLAMSVGDVPNLHVAHFHGLCMQVAHEAGLAVPEPPAGGADRDYFEQTLPGLLEEGSRVLGPRYDAIVVDESQDFRAVVVAGAALAPRRPRRGHALPVRRRQPEPLRRRGAARLTRRRVAAPAAQHPEHGSDQHVRVGVLRRRRRGRRRTEGTARGGTSRCWTTPTTMS